jgi:multidrug efflux pump subunit AcrA (membrane-fusion protein)
MANLGKIAFGILLTVIGLVAGRFLAGSAPTGGGETACTESAAPTPAGGLSPQAIKNLGVEVGPVVREDFALTRKVQAVVADRPLNRRPVVAPIGGIVTEVHVQTGQVVKMGETLLTLARDPIPRPKPDLTADLLTPISEEVHEAAARLRLALSESSVTKRELDRIEPFVQDRTIPGKTAIDLRYQLAKSEQEVENARLELRTHGLTEEEIEMVAGGGRPPRPRQLWRRALVESGLWTEVSEAIWTALPEAQRELPWAVVAVGELSAAGMATPELADFVKTNAGAIRRFAEVAGLLLTGTPQATVEILLREGALEPEVVVRASTDAQSWDVETIHARVGQRVAAGDTLVGLYDARVMWLNLQPVGQEIGAVTEALELGDVLVARPLVKDSGPTLDGVRLVRMALQAGEGGRGGRAQAVVSNVPLGCATGIACRSWQLRVGLRYLVEVPVRRLPKRFVLPADAVTAIGSDQLVFIEDGDSFRKQPVHVEYADDDVAVIADDGSIYDGDRVVLRGAFALGLALDRGSAAADPHAGHSHN